MTLAGRLLNKTFDLTQKYGASYINRLYPNEFEYYFISLELVDSDNKTVSYFAFPITPQSISRSRSSLTHISKTQNAINVEKTSTFEPVDIKIGGNFGRNFLFMVGKDAVYTPALSFKKIREGRDGETNEFSNTFKNGFGAMKELDKFIAKSKTLDDNNKPHSILLYNPVFSEDLVVEVMSYSSQTNAENLNRLFQYNLNLVGVAPISSFSKDTETLRKTNNKRALRQVQGKLISTTLTNAGQYVKQYGYTAVFTSNNLSKINGNNLKNLITNTVESPKAENSIQGLINKIKL